MITKVLQIIFLTFSFVSYAFCTEVNKIPNTLEYKLDLKIDYDTKKLYGKCEMRISNESDEPIAVSYTHLTLPTN